MAIPITSQPINDRFTRFATQWKLESRYMSNTVQMVTLKIVLEHHRYG